jgi:hypothetical protein
MAIITKPAVSKNTPAVFTLNRAELAAVPLVTASAYFSNVANWKYVRLFYQSSPGNQQEFVVFDGTQANPQSNFLVSAKARDVFQIQKITIEDFDKGFLEIPRSQLNVADFDVTITAPVAPAILNIQSPAAGAYSAGNVLTFQVNFTSTIQKPVTGSPRLQLTVGSVTRYANIVTTGDTSSIQFTYTIQGSDTDSDGIVVDSIDLNGGAIVAPSGVAANLSFAPINTGITISTPSTNFTVNELPGFSEVDQVIPFQEKSGASYVPILLVTGKRPADSPFTRLYKVDANLNVTIPLVLQPTTNDTITFEFNRSAQIIEAGTGQPVIYFRARNSNDNRKMFAWNPNSAIYFQASDTNPSGEDLPEAFFVTDFSNPGETATFQVIYFSALNASGLRKLFRLNTTNGNVTQVQDIHPGFNDNPSDFISFTHNNGETYTYYLAEALADNNANNAKALYRIDRFGTIVNIPLPISKVPINTTDGVPFTMNFAFSYSSLGISGTASYIPSSSNTFTRDISSMIVYQNRLIFFGANQNFQIGPMFGAIDRDGNIDIISMENVNVGENLQYVTSDSEKVIYNNILYYSAGYNGSSFVLSAIFSDFTVKSQFISAVNSTVLTKTSTGNKLYFKSDLPAFSQAPLYDFNSTLSTGTKIGEISATDPLAKFLTPGSFGNSGIGLSGGGLRIVEFSGYIYFPADVRSPGASDPYASKMYRVEIGSLQRQEVFNANNAYEIANPGPKVTDRPMNIIPGLGKVFFSAYDWDSTTVKLYYVTHI